MSENKKFSLFPRFVSVRVGKENVNLGALDEMARGMVRGVVELSETSVKEAMIPRTDTVFISENDEREQMFSRVIESGHSRFPVYRDTIDNVVGTLYVKDLISYLLEGLKRPISEILRPVYFVPISMKLASLLKEMKQRHVHIAVVVDEYGGVAGIITMENVLEKIVGDIQDEFDDESEEIVSLSENIWLCDARMNLEDLNEKLGSEIPVDDFETLGGFVFDLFGKIPARLEKIRWGNYTFVIHTVEGHKIRQIKVIKEAEPD